MTKPFHAGRAAHAGVVSARLAAAGYTAASDALEHPLGYLAAVSLSGRIDLESPVEAGVKWKLPRDRLSVKKYPLCFCTHRALDGALDLVQAESLRSDDVRHVTVSISRRAASVLRNHAPQNALEAKFSIEFAMASALVARRAGLSELSDDFVRRPDVQALMTRVAVTPDDREDAGGYALYDQVRIETTDGRSLDTGPITKVRGGPDLPLGREELWSKFEDCVKAGGGSVEARSLFEALMSLETLPHVGKIPGLLAA